MKIAQLLPMPKQFETFRRDRLRYIPQVGGCYALTTFSHDVLYVGLAIDLQRRMSEHLDTPLKRAPTRHGRAIFFFWLQTADLNRVERTWMNTYLQAEGRLPPLNKMYSPTPV
jgi:hypothetical protein